jgi:hypothetical protein
MQRTQRERDGNEDFHFRLHVATEIKGSRKDAKNAKRKK